MFSASVMASYAFFTWHIKSTLYCNSKLECLYVCRWLLGSVIVLGLMHGIAFSASYQMVARFANKNTISLGLGCVGSGLLALALEVVLEVGPKPTRTSFIILFEIAAGGLLPCLNSYVKRASVVVCIWWTTRKLQWLGCIAQNGASCCVAAAYTKQLGNISLGPLFPETILFSTCMLLSQGICS